MNRRRANLNYLKKRCRPASAPSQAVEGFVLSCPSRVLGIDASLRCTGYGVVEILDSDKLRIVDCGVIRTTRQELLSECLRRLRGGIGELLSATQPAAVALESGFFHRNAKTAMVLGAARGVVIATIAEHNVPIFEYAPRQIKQAICGHGNAGKQQIALMVSQLLGLSVAETDDDATDALAAALCHVSLATRQGGLFLPPQT